MKYLACALPLLLAWLLFYVLDPWLDRRHEQRDAQRWLDRQRHPSSLS